MQLIYKMSRQVRVGRVAVHAKQKVNKLVTASHIWVTLAWTTTQGIIIFYQSDTQAYLGHYYVRTPEMGLW